MSAQEACFLGQLQFVIEGEELVANKMERSVIVLKIDRESAEALVENSMYHPRTKKILATYHCIRDRVAEGEIILDWVKSEMNGADMMTKYANVGVQKTNKMLNGMVQVKIFEDLNIRRVCWNDNDYELCWVSCGDRTKLV